MESYNKPPFIQLLLLGMFWHSSARCVVCIRTSFLVRAEHSPVQAYQFIHGQLMIWAPSPCAWIMGIVSSLVFPFSIPFHLLSPKRKSYIRKCHPSVQNPPQAPTVLRKLRSPHHDPSDPTWTDCPSTLKPHFLHRPHSLALLLCLKRALTSIRPLAPGHLLPAPSRKAPS